MVSKLDASLIDIKSKPSIHKYSEIVLESQFEVLFNTITELAATQCNAPIALITFLDSDNAWVYSKIGSPGKTTKPARNRLCKVIPKDLNFFEILDVDMDIQYHHHSLVLDAIKTKYYAGAKISLPLGEMNGVLCIFDVKKRTLTDRQRNLLLGLAQIIEKSLVTKNFLKCVI